MISRPKFSCGLAADVRAAVEPDEHRRVLRDRDQQIAEVAERVLAEQLDLPAARRPDPRAASRPSSRVAFVGAERAGDLAVGGGEVVVPEERHLLLERTLRVHHPEQPALARVVDVRSRQEPLPRGGHADVAGAPDLGVDVVGKSLEVEQAIDRRAKDIAP